MTGSLALCRRFFSKPASSKPISCGLNVILPKLATTLMPRDGDVGATTLKDGCQFLSLTCRNQRIQASRPDEYGKMAEVPNYLGNQWYHHVKEHRSFEVTPIDQNLASREVCTVGMADDNQSSCTEPVSFGSGADELR